MDEAQRKAFERDRENTRLMQVEDHESYAESRLMEDISRCLPMTARRRPDWDLEALRALGCSRVTADRRAGERVWSEEEKINYASTPGFLIRAVK